MKDSQRRAMWAKYKSPNSLRYGKIGFKFLTSENERDKIFNPSFVKNFKSVPKNKNLISMLDSYPQRVVIRSEDGHSNDFAVFVANSHKPKKSLLGTIDLQDGRVWVNKPRGKERQLQ
jgi:hypothetical protein